MTVTAGSCSHAAKKSACTPNHRQGARVVRYIIRIIDLLLQQPKTKCVKSGSHARHGSVAMPFNVLIAAGQRRSLIHAEFQSTEKVDRSYFAGFTVCGDRTWEVIAIDMLTRTLMANLNKQH